MQPTDAARPPGLPDRGRSTRAGKLDPKGALLDAAEKILISEGYAGVTTRRVASVAGLNQALVHYHFGSLPALYLAVHDRMSERFQRRIIRIFASSEPLTVKWQQLQELMFYSEVGMGYPKIHLELMTLAANRPDLKDRVVARLAFMRTILIEALRAQLRGSAALEEKDLVAIATMAQLALQGCLTEKILGYERGHADVFAMLDAGLKDLLG
jgi:AcrR family transcriptional regulator